MRDPDFHELDRDYRSGGAAYAYAPQKPDLWQRMSRVMEVFLYLLILAAILRIFWPEVEKQRTLNSELSEIERQQAEREARVADLRQEYELLKSDREYLETVARDRLDLSREGEHIIRIERPEQEEEPLPDAVDSAELPKVKPLKPLK
ncbi:MAG: septum formation initiator family protein [Verrucomicrobiae bacterium]|nr:septum formation initiator family protein [Verrucomicrobiae bacterium]